MNHKFDGSRVYFTSDTHFNHANIIGFCKRPFKSVEAMFSTSGISAWVEQQNGQRFLID